MPAAEAVAESAVGVDDTARWLLRRKALRETRAASPVVHEQLDRTEPEERVVSPLFDLERERADATAWAQRQRGLVTLEPEPELEPATEPEELR